MKFNLKKITAIIIFSTNIYCQNFIEYPGTKNAPGNEFRIVMVTGDEEYRSEEALTMLGKILAGRHGFPVRVTFAINPSNGRIDPNYQENIPGLDALDSADLMILFVRFRDLPNDQMKHIIDFTNSGKPIIGIRTSTHPFDIANSSSLYAKYDDGHLSGGYGKIVFGEKWISHHGDHGTQSTRGVVVEKNRNHPVLIGVEDVWGPTDVYGIRSLPENSNVLINGQVLSGMDPNDSPVQSKGLTPIVWERKYTGDSGKVSQVLMSTIGASVDFESEDLRRIFVNAVYWMTGMGSLITDSLNVNVVDGPYTPTEFGFNKFKIKVPQDYKMNTVFQPWPDSTVSINRVFSEKRSIYRKSMYDVQGKKNNWGSKFILMPKK